MHASRSEIESADSSPKELPIKLLLGSSPAVIHAYIFYASLREDLEAYDYSVTRLMDEAPQKTM